jgi:Protein of unknown function (DUF3105)
LTKSSRRPSPASRAVRRSRRPAPRRATFLERYRNLLLWVGGIAVFAGLVFVGFIAPGLTPAYACANMFEPTPAPSFVAPSQAPVASGATPAPQLTAPAPGYVEPDMGRLHITPVGAKITYTWCPPASGNHYSAAGQGPIPAGFYDKDSKTVPGGWVHNLEHGYEVLLYKCPGPGCTDEGQAQLQALLSTWPDTPVCHTPPGQFNPIIARFDDMAYPFAAIVWDMVLPMQTLDEDQMFAFYNAYSEQFNPEKQPGCVLPSASPVTPTAPPATPSPAPTTAAPAASTAPAGS